MDRTTLTRSLKLWNHKNQFTTNKPADRGVKFNDWTVLAGQPRPAVLIEYAFIQHPEDWKRMQNNQNEYVKGAAAGIKEYLNS